MKNLTIFEMKRGRKHELILFLLTSQGSNTELKTFLKIKKVNFYL